MLDNLSLEKLFGKRIGKKNQNAINEEEKRNEETKYVEMNDMGPLSQKQKTKQLLERCEKQLEIVGETIIAIKDGQLKMKEELEYQNKHLLPNLNKAVDENITETQKSNRKIQKLLDSASNRSLYGIITIETLILVGMIVL